MTCHLLVRSGSPASPALWPSLEWAHELFGLSLREASTEGLGGGQAPSPSPEACPILRRVEADGREAWAAAARNAPRSKAQERLDTAVGGTLLACCDEQSESSSFRLAVERARLASSHRPASSARPSGRGDVGAMMSAKAAAEGLSASDAIASVAVHSAGGTVPGSASLPPAARLDLRCDCERCARVVPKREGEPRGESLSTMCMHRANGVEAEEQVGETGAELAGRMARHFAGRVRGLPGGGGREKVPPCEWDPAGALSRSRRVAALASGEAHTMSLGGCLETASFFACAARAEQRKLADKRGRARRAHRHLRIPRDEAPAVLSFCSLPAP